MPNEVHETLDVTRVDGPYSPERTAAAASLIADAVRYLNHATMPATGAPGISSPVDVDDVLGALQLATRRLDQTLSQLQHSLRSDLATGRVRLDRGGTPAPAVEEACGELEAARSACGTLGVSLGRARRHTSAMYLDSQEEADDAR